MRASLSARRPRVPDGSLRCAERAHLVLPAGTGTVTPKSAKMLQPEEYAGAKNQLGDAAALQPDIFVAAPAVLDKVLIGVKKIFSELTGLKKAAVDDGLASGFAKFDSGDPSGGPSAACGLKPLITKIAFGKVKKLLGGKVKVFITGSAPLGVEVCSSIPRSHPPLRPSGQGHPHTHSRRVCIASHRCKSLCRPSSAARCGRASA